MEITWIEYPVLVLFSPRMDPPVVHNHLPGRGVDIINQEKPCSKLALFIAKVLILNQKKH